jgi:hypothetical protein
VFGLSSIRKNRKPQVRSGAVFRRVGPGDLIETAKVIQIQSDAMGIPHVRYDLKVQKAKDARANFQDRRTLNLATFATQFTEPVEA